MPLARFTAISLTYVNTVVLAREDFEAIAALTPEGLSGVRERWRAKVENPGFSSKSFNDSLVA